jgi:hypothetical protein
MGTASSSCEPEGPEAESEGLWLESAVHVVLTGAWPGATPLIGHIFFGMLIATRSDDLALGTSE